MITYIHQNKLRQEITAGYNVQVKDLMPGMTPDDMIIDVYIGANRVFFLNLILKEEGILLLNKKNIPFIVLISSILIIFCSIIISLISNINITITLSIMTIVLGTLVMPNYKGKQIRNFSGSKYRGKRFIRSNSSI